MDYQWSPTNWFPYVYTKSDVKKKCNQNIQVEHTLERKANLTDPWLALLRFRNVDLSMLVSVKLVFIIKMVIWDDIG